MRATVTTESSTIAENDHTGTGDGRAAQLQDEHSRSFLIKNKTASAAVFLEIVRDDADATAAAGFEWATDDGPIEVTLEPGEKLKGILDTGGGDQTLHVLRGGR